MYYAVDYDTHPQYHGYWVVRFASRKERDAFIKNEKREALKASSRAVRWARKHNAFYDEEGVKMVPERYF